MAIGSSSPACAGGQKSTQVSVDSGQRRRKNPRCIVDSEAESACPGAALPFSQNSRHGDQFS